MVLKAKLKGLKDERREVELLLSAARCCEARGPDIKALALLEAVQRLQREDNDPQLKVIVFTEFVPTQAMLADFLTQRGFTVVCLNGSLDLEERKQVQRRFATDAQVLVSTDAGSEGLNLQFHILLDRLAIEDILQRSQRFPQGVVLQGGRRMGLEPPIDDQPRRRLRQPLSRVDQIGVGPTARCGEGPTALVSLVGLALRAPWSGPPAPVHAGPRARGGSTSCTFCRSCTGMVHFCLCWLSLPWHGGIADFERPGNQAAAWRRAGRSSHRLDAAQEKGGPAADTALRLGRTTSYRSTPS